MDEELLTLWNQFADPTATLLNTHLLYRLAARPFFDFFFEDIDQLAFDNKDDKSLIHDDAYKALVDKKQNQCTNITSLIAAVQSARTSVNKKVLLLSYGIIVPQELTSDMQVVVVGNPDMFGNVEGVWKGIRKQLNNIQFDACFVAMRAERSWIIPRLKSVYNVPILDVSYDIKTPQANKFIQMGKKVARKLLLR